MTNKTMNETVMDGKKFYEKEYATKGVGNTALGLSIGALGVELLRNGGLNNLLGGVMGTPQSNPEQTPFFELYKGYRDADDAIIAKHNEDSFALYKYSRDGFDSMQKEISDLKTKLAVAEAVQPWKDKSIYDAIALEAERRCCNDGKIVNYSNQMFYPVSIADVTTGTTSTVRLPFNPICGCC